MRTISDIEIKVIKRLIKELGLNKIYLSKLVDEQNNSIQYVELINCGLVCESLNIMVNDIVYSVEEVRPIVVTMIYCELQKLIREFNKDSLLT